ncbi:MAG: DNA-3-methyladenine glycosylase [Bacteroidota bacterium]|nr:DNA-3-methyladenine glycosylase [Bacteroidota bacterium]
MVGTTKGKRLPVSYYQSLDVTTLAKDLLGKILCTNIDGHYCSGKIIETEAYRGPDDRACHAYNDRRTPRTEVMFNKGGVAYIYICYGMHHLMNVVTGPRDHAHAILIRALEPVNGIDVMAMRREMSTSDLRLTKGPGALSVAMGLHNSLTGSSLYSNSSPVWIEDRGLTLPSESICISKRIGVESAGEAAHWMWRFFEKGNRYVSAKRTCG